MERHASVEQTRIEGMTLCVLHNGLRQNVCAMALNENSVLHGVDKVGQLG